MSTVSIRTPLCCYAEALSSQWPQANIAQESSSAAMVMNSRSQVHQEERFYVVLTRLRVPGYVTTGGSGVKGGNIWHNSADLAAVCIWSLDSCGSEV